MTLSFFYMHVYGCISAHDYFSLESKFCEHEWNKSSNPLAELEPWGKQEWPTEAKNNLQSFLPIIVSDSTPLKTKVLDMKTN